jgi:hypothetical protein
MYKVGDKVLVEVEIVEVDLEDSSLPYLVKFDGETTWVGKEDIRSALPSIDQELEMEDKAATEELKYKIGDKVQHKYKPEWGIGTITQIDTSIFDIDYLDDSYDEVYDLPLPYLVRYPEYKNNSNDEGRPDVWYTKESNIILVTEEN